MTTNLVRSPLFNDFEALFNTFNQSPFTSTNRISSLNYRVLSEEDSSVVEVEVPGVEPADVKVKLEGRQLSVDTPKGSVFFSLGTRIDASNATANLKHGLLTIKIPKREATTVEVKVLTE
jgi:HSP20 family molecular chaperone IbpA